MKEKLIKFWEAKLRMIIKTEEVGEREAFFNQAYGALELIISQGNLTIEEETNLCRIWDDQWRGRLLDEVYNGYL